MRRLGPDEWSGLAMLVVAVVVAGPVLLGAADPTIPRGLWIAVFAVLIGALLVAAAGAGSSRRAHAAFALAVSSSWAVLLTAPGLGLLPVLLVVVAAVSVYVVPLRVGLLVVALNTAVIALASARQTGDVPQTLIITGFYLLIQLASVLSSVAVVREQRMRRELTEAHVDLRAATVLLSESARTAERLRISRDLHDLIGHQLTVLTLELEAAHHREGEQARVHVARANRVARDLLTDVRTTVGELRGGPPDLAGALRQVVRDLPGLDVTISVAPEVRVDEAQTVALVRAVQEIVTNTIRHAGARTLTIDVVADRSGVVLTAVDDGTGAREPVPGNGLRGLVERFEALGGDVSFGGDQGFRVTARVPMS
ncbi:sensor histidine kinase [Blastococcus sp. SYSU DS1024]